MNRDYHFNVESDAVVFGSIKILLFDFFFDFDWYPTLLLNAMGHCSCISCLFIHSSSDMVFVHVLFKIPLPRDSTNVLPAQESAFHVTKVICTVIIVSSTFWWGQFDAKCFVESHGIWYFHLNPLILFLIYLLIFQFFSLCCYFLVITF